MTCDIKSNTESWLDYMRSAPEIEAAAALGAAHQFLQQIRWQRPSADRSRLRKIITKGEKVYESRFGESWAPF